MGVNVKSKGENTMTYLNVRTGITTSIALSLTIMSGSVLAKELNEKQLRRCMVPIVLQTKEVKKLKFNNHEFNCRGISGWKSTNGVTAIKGGLSHHLSYRPDDKINWSFKLNSSGKASDIKANIKRGGGGSVLKKIIPPIAKYYGQKISEEQVGTFFKWTGKIWDGKWESTAEAIVGGIATHLSVARTAAKKGIISRKPVFYYNIAPRSSGPYRWHNAKDVYSCRKACTKSSNCAVWSFENRKRSNGKKGELHCKLFSESQFKGFKSQTRTITGRVKNRPQ